MPRVVFKIAIGALSCALSILLLEGAFRLYEQHFLIHEIDASAEVYDLLRYEYNDHEGLLERARAEGEFRILSFGDSFAESVTRAPYSYASVLQQGLAAQPGRGRVRVVNFGRNGTSFPDYAAQYRLWDAEVEYDAVLFNLYSGNDFKDMSGVVFVEGVAEGVRPGAEDTARLYGPGMAIPRRHSLRVLDYLQALQLGWRHSIEPGKDAHLYQPRAAQFRHERYLKTLASQLEFFRPDRMSEQVDAYFWLFKLLTLAREIEDRGIRVAITLAPPHFAVSSPWLEQVLSLTETRPDQIELDLPAWVVAELAREAGFQGPVIDLAPCLRVAEEQGEEVYWGTNTHWSVRGNEIVGELLADELSRRWPGSSAARRGDPSQACRATVSPAPPAVKRGIEDAAETIQALLRFERTTLAALLGREFQGREELFEALAAAGYRREPQVVRGEYWGYLARKQDALIRPHGLRSFVRPHGWAVDLGAPGESVFVAFFHRGRVIGVGRTRGLPAPGLPGLPGVDDETPNVMFHTMMKTPRPGLRGPPEVWAVAISPRGSFSPLPEVPRRSE